MYKMEIWVKTLQLLGCSCIFQAEGDVESWGQPSKALTHSESPFLNGEHKMLDGGPDIEHELQKGPAHVSDAITTFIWET